MWYINIDFMVFKLHYLLLILAITNNCSQKIFNFQLVQT